MISEYLKKIKWLLLHGGGIRTLFKTIWFNFKFLPLSKAIFLPVFISHLATIKHCYKGFYEGEGKTGSLMFAGHASNCYPKRSFIDIKGKIIIHGNGKHYFGPGLIITIGKNGIIEIGNKFSVSYDSKFHIYNKLKIGDDNMWSHNIVVRDTDGHPIYDYNDNLINANKNVSIGNNVWIGCYSIILKGSRITDGSIIGARSLITKSFQENNSIIVDGNKIIKKDVRWERKSLE